MYTAAALTDIHARCHATFAKLIAHCGNLTADELHRKLDGFGYETVQLQLHHAIGAERYWMGVLQGRMDVDEDEADYPTAADLAEMRENVAADSAAFLAKVTDAELSEPREVITWGERKKTLVPAHVILRTQTHLFHHQGQVLAMCRLMGKPANGFDFPLEPEV